MPTTPRLHKRFFFDRPVWTNSTGTEELHPLEYFAPKDLPTMEACVAKAIKDELHIRAVGSGHSFSDAAFTEDLLVGTHQLNKVLGKYPHTTSSAELLEVQAGIRIRDLNKKLDAMQLSIRAMGGYDGQTIAGAVLTGTHGSSLTYGAISRMVRSLVLVTNDLDVEGVVRSYRIEPHNGITDRAQYPADQPKLIQDDDVFNSVVVSFGSMGLIYSMVLDVEPTYYLDEKRKAFTWPEVKEKLRGGLLRTGECVFVQINPYPEVEGAPEEALIMTHRRITDPKELAQVSRWREDLGWIWDSLGSARRSLLLLVAGHFKFTYWWLVWRMNADPKRISKILGSAISAQEDRSYKHKAHRVMYQGAAFFKLNAYDGECALPIHDPEVDYLAVLDALLQHLRDLHRDHGSHLSAPVGLRFVKGSDIFLTPEYGGDVCYVDCPVLKHAYGNNNIVGRLQHFWRQHHARPHWGKRNELYDSADIVRFYPKFPQWEFQFKRFNRNGIFSNAFTKRMVEPKSTGDSPGVEGPPQAP